ncbi:immunoglobulin-like domain-containing protein [Stigmatella erecta]|uniref:HYR domain-containing protein n=1 Tax=Stigmatella erecta TaxID=83460 RepID=A0A1I0K0W9_9BACT|nr:immunoglobulin-like domain-containing protein [Stigmatella erecta]SEU16475.1 HYR domain-containing protein [Stigmatella erecta]
MKSLAATYAVLSGLLWAPVSLADTSQFATNVEKRYTTQDDFAQGTASGLRPSEATPGQLELQFGPPYLWIGNPSTGYVIKTDARTGKPVAWYHSVLLKNWDQSAPAVSPLGSACNYPSVAAVNAAGDAFVVNRGNCPGTYASLTKYAGSLSACVDRNGNGVIDTSFDENGDGIISLNNPREFPGQSDECILWTKNYAGVDDPGRSLVVDEEQNLWAVGHASAKLYKISGQTGAVLESINLKADTEVAQVQGLAIGPGGFLYASDASSQRRVRKIDISSASGIHVVDSVITPVPTSGISVDASGGVWVGAESDSASGPLRVDFTAHSANPVAGGCTGRSRGTAVDAQGRVWVACWSSRRLMGIGPHGGVLGVWALSERPEGVAVDSNGKIWLNSGVSSVLWKVDPAVPQTVQSFPVGTAPLSVGDATGYQHHHFILSEGHWSAIHDSGRDSITWGNVTWNTEAQGAQPTGSRITVQIRAANTREALPSLGFRTVLNNQPDAALSGRFIEVKVSLRAANFSGTPVLSDLNLYSFNHPPVARCEARNVCAGPACVAEASVDNGSYDPDGESLSYSQSPAGPYSIGQRAVTLTVSDGSEAQSCSAAVRVRDCEPPSIVCAAPSVFECTGNESAQVTPAGAQAADQCSEVSVSGPGAAAYPLGSTPLTYQARDAAGNTATCHTTLKVQDTLAPAIACPGPITAECVAGGASSEGVADATARDQCSAVALIRPEHVRVPVGSAVSLTFSAQDTSGNRAACSTPFKVEDTQAPTLALKGQALERVECGASFGDAGATASDVCAGDLSAQVVATGTVNPAQLGSYSVRYGVTDPAGNPAAAVSRTVVVEDTVAPVLALSGPAQQALECGDAHVDPGATASDVCAGDLTQKVERGGLLDPMAPGSYVLTYTVEDPSQNAAAPVARTVSVADTQAPLLRLAGASNVPLECGSAYVDPGAQANDLCAGDLTSAIQVLGSVDAFTLGAQTLTYRVTDPSGHEASPVNRVITVSDTQPPVVALHGAAQASLECGAAFGDPGASAHDACAGDLSGQISKTGQVDTGTPGAYALQYGAVDAAGNSAVATRTVTVTDSAPPVLQLVGPTSMAQECATPFTDPSATAFDACLGDVSQRITVSGAVNTAQPGAYVLTYNAVDTVGNAAVPVQRTVQVTDSEKPSLVLKGANPVALECNRDTYAEPGATAVDRCAGDLSASISIQGDTVNPSIPRDYAVTYRAVDGAGNAATAVRNVRVQDTLAPSIVLKGALAPVLECKASTFTDEGATAQDLCSGNLSGAITVTGSVNTALPGAYPVRYRVQDGQGLWAEKTRDVRVADTRRPVITLLGSGSPVVECTRGTFVDPGATATDLCAGDLSGKITVTGASKITGPGTYPITYNVKDPSGNAALTVTRNVKVQDTMPPSLTVNGAATMTLECKQDTYTELGATAQDACDGPLTFATYGTVNTQSVAVYSVQYQTHDSSHRYVSATRTVEVVDRLPPTLTLKGPAALHHECASGSYVDPGATASDVCYGELSSSVVIDHNVNAWVPATYQVTLNVQDGTGLKAPTLTRTVTVADTQAPVLEYRQVVLSPANHGMHTLSLDNCATANDRCDGWADINTGSIVSIYSDEPEEAPGDGDGATLQDIVITGKNTFSVRAESQSGGNGRVYGVNFTLKDRTGNTREGLCKIQVPAEGSTAVDNGPGSGYTVQASTTASLASRVTP